MKKIIFSIGIAFLFASCSVYKTTTTKTMDVSGGGIIQTPVIVDLDVKPNKVSGTATGKKEVPIENVRQSAIADAVKSANADVLVEPRFETTITSSNKTIVVSGYPANYKNFRQMTNADTTLIQVSSLYKASVYEPATVQKKSGKKGRGYLVLGAIVIALIVGATSGS